MIRRFLPLLLPVLALAACAESQSISEAVTGAGRRGDTVSSMNFLLQPIDPVCAKRAVLEADGFGLRGDLRRQGDAQRFEAVFNDDLAVSVIVRQRPDRTAEVSVFSKLSRRADPLMRREAEFAVAAADEAIYRACTADGQINPDGDGDVFIDAE